MKQSVMQAGGLSANLLKLWAIFAMLVDHTAWLFVPTDSAAGFIMHLIGRTTIPIMCYFVAEGYHHTRSISRYALRLGIFAALSYLPFIFFETGKLPQANSFLDLNVLYTLLIGLLALCAFERLHHPALKLLSLVFFCLLAQPGDWGMYSVLFILAFGLNRGNFRRQAIWFSAIAVIHFIDLTISFAGALSLSFWESAAAQAFQLGPLLALPLLALYNGQRGKGNKWAFYLFYPVHLILLRLLWMIIEP